MSAPTFALLAGLLFTALGFMGFVPAFMVSDRVLGLFPVNDFVNAVHIVVGFWGLFSWSGATSAVNYARALAPIFGVLALIGIYGTAAAPLGLFPLRGHDVWLHGAASLLGAYFGFRSIARRERNVERRRNAPNRRVARRPVAYERRTGAWDRRQVRYGGDPLAAE
ncbi:MAG TPA: DUF4383 domain-containing protein [Burkholderiales bacterium]|nr:DUF4383 domain-containing protein [Burkholderiales bacterium]